MVCSVKSFCFYSFQHKWILAQVLYINIIKLEMILKKIKKKGLKSKKAKQKGKQRRKLKERKKERKNDKRVRRNR